jgi:hypothetical protein
MRPIDAWFSTAMISEGRLFRAMHMRGGALPASASQHRRSVEGICEDSEVLGSPVAPHDLRRKFARLAFYRVAESERDDVRNIGEWTNSASAYETSEPSLREVIGANAEG